MVNATNYYVKTGGSDGAAGTSPATAWATITKVNSSFSGFSAGDSVLFNRGDVFYGRIVPSHSGSSGNAIVLGSYGTGEKPIITGLTDITAWTSLGSNIWETTSAISTLSYTNMVVVNGINTPMGRTPNTGSTYTFQSHTGLTSITSSDLTGTPDWTGSELVMFMTTYSIGRNPVTSQTGSTVYYTACSCDAGVQYNDEWFFFQADPRTLDQQNEWYYNTSTKKLQIYSTTSPTGVQISTIDTLAWVTNVNYITFDNIQFIGANISGVEILLANHITIQNCTFNYSGKNGTDGDFTSASANNSVLNCDFTNSNNCAINWSQDFTTATLSNNTIDSTAIIQGMMSNGGGAAIAIAAYGASSLIELNTIEKVGYSGISFRNSNVIVQKNFIDSACMLLHDGAGIYTYPYPSGTPTTGRQISKNIILNCGAGGLSDAGIYADDHSTGIEIVDNTVANCGIGYYLHNDSSIYMHRNTAYNSGYMQFLFNNFDATITTASVVITNNIFFAKQAAQYTAWYALIGGTIPAGLLPDSNYYARPIDDNTTIETQLGAVYTTRTLASWQSVSGRDANSHISPWTISNTNELVFTYNYSDTPVDVVLGAVYIDIYNVTYNGTITIPAYGSAILKYVSPLDVGSGIFKTYWRARQ